MSENLNLKHFEVLSSEVEPMIDMRGPLMACGQCSGDGDTACFAWCPNQGASHDGCCCTGETDAGGHG